MALETSTTIKGLNEANPVGATDKKREGDDHLRMIKQVLQYSFPDQDHARGSLDDSGVADAYQVTFTKLAPLSYVKYMEVTFLVANTNTGASTLQVNALGAKAIKTVSGQALAAGALVATRLARVVYDGTNFILISAGGGDIEAGAVALFVQAACPAGWTQDTTNNDKVMRVVSGTGGGTGGDWTFTGFAIDGHALTEAEMPSHAHAGSTATATSAGAIEILMNSGSSGAAANGDVLGGAASHKPDGDFDWKLSAQTNITHNHTLTVTSEGSDNTHTHGVTNTSWRPAYVDVVACTKD